MNDLIDSFYSVLNNSTDVEDWSALVGNIDKEALKRHHVGYTEGPNGIRVDFEHQSKVQIFKTQNDFYNHSKQTDFEKNIIIIQDRLLFEPNKKANFIFDNVLYSFKFFDLLKEKISFHIDLSKKQLIFLSEKTGKNIIGYRMQSETDLTKDLQLKKYFSSIESRNDDFLIFLKNSIVSNVESVNFQDRYITILKNLEVICGMAQRDFDLYQSKFSFLEFEEKLEVVEAKYIVDIQSFVSDFSSKLHLPIEFGIYIVLIFKFSDSFYPLFATLIMIISWGSFNFWSNSQSLDSVNSLKETIVNAFEGIEMKSGQETSKSKAKINKEIGKITNKINAYKCLSAIFSIFSIFIIVCLLIPLLK